MKKMFGKAVRDDTENYLRAASPNERRCIARDYLDFYRGLAVGGTYDFSDGSNLSCPSTYTRGLQKCIERHPQLSVVTINAESNSPYFEHYPKVDLEQHLQHLDKCKKDGDEDKAIQNALPGILDTKLLPSIPAWKVFILPLSEKRCFIAFFYSHTLGDGMSGLAFHQTLLSGLEVSHIENELPPSTRSKDIGPASDTPRNLPITWPFFLRTLLGIFLPKPLLSILGLEALNNAVTSATWTGSPVFYNAEKHTTGVRTITIDGTIVSRVLRVSRSHGVKLTGLLHQLIVGALSEFLPQSADISQFVAQTSLSLRGALNISGDKIGNFISADTATLPKNNKMRCEAEAKVNWSSAKAITERLAAVSKDLRNHPIGLLPYVSDMRSWTLSKVGGSRDCSYEVSNLTSFRPVSPGGRATIVKMVFCQPASVTGAPLSFNVVSVANGPLSIAVSWQLGALGFDAGEDEREIVEIVCRKIELGFRHLASTS
ncbi:hypothetical protein LTR84_000252 [Exophiala bonariae]|uniref:Alcohol acetyltransferase FCK4 n=1 Tax=Exophiala bonariae TaxID=1690606 RepID=A0AAV9NQ22_9EURO|nr:hypothetical protein LTR84_000252 [Exophiala bonariae]